MATYYIMKTGDGSDGTTEAKAWKTFAAAINSGSVGNGDTVRVGPGVYKEPITIKGSLSGSTWEAHTPSNRPVIDGNYGPSEVGKNFDAKTSYIPGSMDAGIVTLNTACTFDGFIIQNVAGAAVRIGGSGVTLKNCRTYHLFNMGIVIAGPSAASPISNITVSDCQVYLMGLKLFVPRAAYTLPERRYRGGAHLKTSFCDNVEIYNCEFAYGYGEGVDIDFGSELVEFRNNEVHDAGHSLLYNMASRRNKIHSNLVYHSPIPDDIINDNGRVSAGLVYGDENEAEQRSAWPSSEVAIYNNLVVNAGELFDVRAGDRYTETALIKCRISHNTFVAGPNTRHGIFFNNDARLHANSVFENNIIDWSNAPTSGADVLYTKWAGDRVGVTFRNNLWNPKPPDYFQGTNDQYGDPNLADASYLPSVSSNGYPYSVSFNTSKFKLTASSTKAVGKASNGTGITGLPALSITKDYFGATRDSSPDIGFHEFGGTIVDPPPGEPTITASFTIDDNDGTEPHTIAVTDTSTVENDTISARIWIWGDSTPNGSGSSASHTYAEAGIYTVRLIVETTSGLQDSATGTVTVRANDDGGGPTSDAITDVASFDLTTSANTEQSLTFSLGGRVPKWAIIMLTKATAFDTQVDDAVLSVGLWGSTSGPFAGPDEVCSYISSEDGTSSANQVKFIVPGYAGMYRDFDTLNTHSFAVVDASPNTLKIKTSSVAFPSAFKLVVIAGAGSAVRGQIVYYNPLGVQDATIFPQHNVNAKFLVSLSSYAVTSTVTAGSELSLGLATGSANQRNMYWGQPEGAVPSINRNRMSEDRFGFARFQQDGVTNNPARINLVNLTSTGAEIAVKQADVNKPFSYLAVETDAPVDLRTVTVPPLAASPLVFDTGFTPAAYIAIPTTMTALTNADDTTGGIGVYIGDLTNEYTALFTSIAAQSTHDTKSEIADSLVARKADGTVAYNGTIGQSGGRPQVTVGSDVGASYLMHILTIGGTSGGGTVPPTLLPNAAFAFSPTTPFINETITIKDLSSGNGETITSWVYDFGDFNTHEDDTDGDTTHAYIEPGTYTITLTVTTSAGSSTASKQITVLDVTGEPVEPDGAFGPPFPQDITEDTESRYISDPLDPLVSYLFMGVDFGSIPIDDNVETLTPKAGKVKLAIVDGDLVARRWDGSIATVAELTWTPVTPPIADFTANKSTIAVDGSVTFANISTDFSRCLWDFGDGSLPSELTSPTHTYESVGVYDVTLTVFNSYGDSDSVTKSELITVVETLPSQTIEVQVVGVGNDGRQRRNPDSIDIGVNALSLTANGYMAGYRWSLPVPQGAAIESAYLKIQLAETGDIDYNVTFEASDNAAIIDDADIDNLSTRTMVSATAIAWESLAAGIDTWHVSPNLAAVLQDVVDRAGYAEDNYVLCRTENTDGAHDTQVRAQGYSTGYLAAKLEVTYSA